MTDPVCFGWEVREAVMGVVSFRRTASLQWSSAGSSPEHSTTKPFNCIYALINTNCIYALINTVFVQTRMLDM